MGIVITPTSASPASTKLTQAPTRLSAGDLGSDGFALLSELRHLVMNENACALPGVTLRYDTFLPVMRGAVEAGWVAPWAADFVAEGLRYGFKLGVDVAKLQGHRWFKNYGTAVQARAAVTKATMARVDLGKTLKLGCWSSGMADQLKAFYPHTCIFPMGAVAKPLEPTAMRPTDDHTRTGLNAATDLSFLAHTLDTYNEIANFLRPGYFMRVSDVEAAFPLLPLHPDLWPFFLFRFYASDADTQLSLFVHLCADFGGAGTPGAFKIFFVDVVVNMARALKVLTLNMPVYVDDCSLIGPDRAQVDREMEAFHAWAWRVCGVAFKAIKDRLAARHQLVLGLWWDSITFTRTLEERKLNAYVEMLADFASRRKLSLKELQVVAGRMQRAVLTLPPGAACLLVGLFGLMAGLALPWHTRRLTKSVRGDLRWLHKLLGLNLGKGFYTYEHFPRAPEVRSDASKSGTYSGGGWVSACGRYSFFQYGTRAARQPIDYLEGDTVVACAQEMGAQWRRRVVPFGIDNTAFQLSLAKNRSKVPRLNNLIREVFVEQVRSEFILDTFWLSSADNELADHLSRDREDAFLHAAFRSQFWEADTPVRRMPGAGAVRRLPETRGSISGLNLVSANLAGSEMANLGEGQNLANLGEEQKLSNLEEQKLANLGEVQKMTNLEAEKKVTVLAVQQKRANLDSPPDDDVVVSKNAANLGQEKNMAMGRFEPATSQSQDGALTTEPTHGQYSSKSSWPFISIRTVLLLGFLSVGTCAPQSASVPYARCSIFEGLPYHLEGRVEQILDNRLSTSSWRTVSAGLKKWRLVAAREGWPTILHSDDSQRGGRLATWVLDMVEDTELVYSSIEGYLWGVRTWMKLQRQADPVLGVMGWDDFMSAVKVLTWVPAEPRRATPYKVLLAIVETIDKSNFKAVQLAFFLLILFFTFSRSECPCPKTYTGSDSFDPDVHWTVADFDIVIMGGRRVLKIRFKRIKQDQRVERPEARGEGDWAYVSEVPESPLCPVTWWILLNSLHGRRRGAAEPFFVNPDDWDKPYLYGKALDDFHAAQIAVGVLREAWSGLHGLRCLGYNRCKSGHSEDMAQAHGGWKSNAHTRYARFSMDEVLRVSAAMTRGVGQEPALGGDTERAAQAPAARVTRHSAVLQGTSGSWEEPDLLLLPEGWTARQVDGPRVATTFQGPRGEVVTTRAAAWSNFESDRVVDNTPGERA